MEPEEIDKLFKDRLSGLPVMPSADAWMRLQGKMEPPKKERTMWIYYAAASVVILLVSGLLLFRNYNQEPATTVVQTEIKAPAEKNIQDLPGNQATTQQPVASTVETETTARVDKETVAVVENEKEPTPKKQKAGVKNKGFENKNAVKLAQAQTKRIVKKSVKNIAATDEPDLDKRTALAFQNQPTETAEPKAPVLATNSMKSSNVVQVLVKLDNTDEKTEAETEEKDFRESISRKGALLKNIYKQARNLKNGEPVELATLGLDTEKINNESKNIKQKLNKVISL
jgi:flagellar basal body-associated protein FliL